MTRRGVVLPIALAIVVVLGLAVVAVFVMRRASYRSLDFIDSYLGAVSVGEAAHIDVVARLESAPWEERFFRGAPAAAEKAWGPGSYEYLVADADAPLEADLVVFAKVKSVDVSMYWRLRAQPGSLIPYRRIRTVIFANLPPGTRARPGALTGTLPGIRDALRRRGANLPWVEGKQGELTRDPAPVPVATALGIPRDGAVDALIRAPNPGGSPEPVEPRVSAGAAAVPPPLPSLPRPAGGAQPATPGTMVSLANVRRSLADALDKAKKALRAYDMFMAGSLGSVLAALRADCAAGIQQACACESAASAAQARAAAVRANIQSCISRIEGVQREIDDAAAVPGPTQDRAERLLADAQSAEACGGNLCGDVKDEVSAANAAVASCGRSVATFPAPGTGAMTTCGMAQ